MCTSSIRFIVFLFLVALVGTSTSRAAEQGEDPAPPVFMRGDATQTGSVVSPIGDALFLFSWQFGDEGVTLLCEDAADADGNGVVNGMVDGLFLLYWRFLDGAPPPAPGPIECGPDPDGDDDGLGCETPSSWC